MPFISDSNLARLQNAFAKYENAAVKAKAIAEQKAGEAKVVAEAAGFAGLLGFLRGMREKDGKDFNIPYTTIDIELVTSMGLIGTAMFDLYGKYDPDALAAGIGALSHYAGQVGRNWGKTGQFGLVAGYHPNPLLNAGISGVSPHSSLAAALGQSGL
jgi:hypothetical protein